MNFRRLVSAVAALAVAGTCVVTSGVSALAADDVLPQINDDYTQMTAAELATAAAEYTVISDCTATTFAAVNAIEGSGIQFYTNERNSFTDEYGLRTLDTTYEGDGKTILLEGTWYTGDTAPTIGSGNRIYFAIQDSSYNDIIRLSANRNDFAAYYSIGGGSETSCATLNNTYTSATITFSVEFVPSTSTITSVSINGTEVATDTVIDATDVQYVRMGRTYTGTDPKNRYVTNAILQSLRIQEVPVLTAAGVTGADEIAVGETETYTPIAVDQYGDEYSDYSGSFTLALKEDVEGITLDADTNAVTVSDDVTGGTTFTLVATSDDSLYTGEKTVTVSSTKGYVLTTTPYALVTVDDSTEAINSGYTGIISFDKSYSDGNTHTVVISKTGYVTTTLNDFEFTLNGSDTYTLTGDGYYYYEDFANVTDTFGFASAATVADGVLKLAPVSTTAVTSTFTNSIDVADKVIEIKDLIGYQTNYKRQQVMAFDGLGLYIWEGGSESDGKILYIDDNSSSNRLTLDASLLDTASTVSIAITSSNKATIYIDGVNYGTITIGGTTWTGISIYNKRNETGGYFSMSSIAVTDYPEITATLSSTEVSEPVIIETIEDTEGEEVATSTVYDASTDTLTTVYIKLPYEPTEAPIITLSSGETAQATAVHSGYNLIEGSYYYIYQFVNVSKSELTGLDVTCTGFADTTIE